MLTATLRKVILVLVPLDADRSQRRGPIRLRQLIFDAKSIIVNTKSMILNAKFIILNTEFIHLRQVDLSKHQTLLERSSPGINDECNVNKCNMYR